MSSTTSRSRSRCRDRGRPTLRSSSAARLRLWLRLIPLAVLPALAVPMVLAPGSQLVASAGEPRLWGAVAVFVLAGRRVNLLVSVAAGVAVVAALRAIG